jgi:hypothetical protein
LLTSCLLPTKAMITNIINVEKSYINITHPDFIGGKQAVAQAQDRVKQLKEQQRLAQMGENAGGILNASNDGSSSTSHPDDYNQGSVRKLTPAAVTVVGTNNSGHNSMAASVRGDEQSGPRAIFDIFSSKNKPGVNNVGGGGGRGGSADSGASQGYGNQAFVTGRNVPAVISGGNSNSGLAKSSSDLNFSNFEEPKELRLPNIPEHIRFMPLPTDKEKIETEIIKILIDSYFGVVKKSFVDLIPKIITHFLLDAFKKGLHNKLVAQLYSENLARDLMRESDDIADKRRNCETMKDILSRAMTVLNEARDFNISFEK